MKKLLLAGVLVLSAVSFARMGGTMGSMGSGMINGRHRMTSGSHMNGNMMNNMSPELRQEMQNDMIKMQEKQLQIRKIMNTSNPDMKKVEKLNNELYQIKANHMNKMHQNMITVNQ
ncbi:hypothetical protein NON08_13350 [Cetobacterium somerae]|uniref:hypothetical protein n=1 Tax=Cetobacterium sp. NK01 TaxID=2993530 RepID=UPI0021160AF6|nr:hypothetical protein [Cetobacterium sp. NK01]MCQ8213487.1 hypothetical protein [Cetobacterium sp. NK01]